MQIFCPKCNTGYEIEDRLLKDRSRKLKCSNCGEVFVVDKLAPEQEENPFDQLAAAMGSENGQDNTQQTAENVSEESTQDTLSENKTDNLNESNAEEKENLAAVDNDQSKDKEDVSPSNNEDNGNSNPNPKEEDIATDNSDADKKSEVTNSEAAVADEAKKIEEDDVDIEDIFERLSERTENLINDEKKLPWYKKIRFWFKNLFGLSFGIKWSYIGIGAVVVCLIWLFNNRYDIVRQFPVANGVFKAFGIAAKIPGEGLEFQNISWDLVTQEDGNQLEIRGFIFNQANRKIRVPTIHVEILDKETAMLQSQNITMENMEVESRDRVALSIDIPQTAPTMKYVYFTFIDVD